MTDTVTECREHTQVVDKYHLLKQYPWVIYVVLGELFTRSHYPSSLLTALLIKVCFRIIPSFLLVCLNAKMIKRFHEIIEKRGIMRAKSFLHGSSQLYLTQTTLTVDEHDIECSDDGEDNKKREKADPLENNKVVCMLSFINCHTF